MTQDFEWAGKVPPRHFDTMRRDIEEGKVKGLRPGKCPDEDKDSFCITDGSSYLWAYRKTKQNVLFQSHGLQRTTDNIIGLLQNHYDDRIYSEYDEEYDEDWR